MVSKIKKYYENLSTIDKMTLRNLFDIYTTLLLLVGSAGVLFGTIYGSIVYFDSIIPAFIVLIILISVLIARQHAIEEYRDRN